jgi:hypothetical protein
MEVGRTKKKQQQQQQQQQNIESNIKINERIIQLDEGN